MSYRYTYQSLPPDVWSECLHYLKPEELSGASKLLPLDEFETDLCPETIAERAAWMAIGSMVKIAEAFWVQGYRATLSETIHPEEARLQELVGNDPSKLGAILRRTTTANQEKQTTDALQFVRFRDESWQGLYELMHGMLNKVSNIVAMEEDDNDATEDDSPSVPYSSEHVSLAVGLIFGGLPSTFLMTPARRKKLEMVAFKGCFDFTDNSRDKRRCLWPLSDARSCLVSDRLGSAGLWDTATFFLQSTLKKNNLPTLILQSTRILQEDTDTADDSKKEDKPQNDSVLMIDVMIHASKFLIDQLYSQTYVRLGGRDDRDLVAAVKYGQMAYNLCKERYSALVALQEKESTPIEDMGWCTQPPPSLSDSSPPPPIESLFANDALRYIHAGLALTKAMCLLGQHVGLGATLINRLGVYPSNYKESTTSSPHDTILNTIRVWHGFFEEAKETISSMCDVMDDQTKIRQNNLTTPLSMEIPILTMASSSASGELMYCMSSVYQQYDLNISKQCVLQSIGSLSKSFRRIVETLCFNPDKDVGLIARLLELLIGCAKDLGKTCAFARNHIGVTHQELFEEGTGGKPRKKIPTANPEREYLDAAYVVSSYTNGSSHPTTQNIRRLLNSYHSDNNSSYSNSRSIEAIYHRVIPWLIEEYCPDVDVKL